MEWYLKVIKNYAGFSGRARRKELWMFLLIHMAVSFVLGFVDGLLGLTIAEGVGILSTIYVLAVFIPTLAVQVRRMHDVGRSGWWLLLSLIPLAGLIVLYWMVKDSDPGSNQYGENPKGM